MLHPRPQRQQHALIFCALVSQVDGCTSCFGQVGGPGAQRAHPDDKSELDFDAAIFELVYLLL